MAVWPLDNLEFCLTLEYSYAFSYEMVNLLWLCNVITTFYSFQSVIFKVGLLNSPHRCNFFFNSFTFALPRGVCVIKRGIGHK